jgi:hypothetical protein
MKIRLTRKFAALINGIDLSKAHTGDTLDLPARDASMLMAEGWAEPAADGGSERDRAYDRPARKRSRAQSKTKR